MGIKQVGSSRTNNLLDTAIDYPTTDTQREKILQRQVEALILSLEDLKTSCEAHKQEINALREQVCDQMDVMDEQKRKIFALEKLLKLYL